MLLFTLEANIDRNNIISNTATHGGGILVSDASSFTMTNSLVAENRATTEGGGMAFYTDPVFPVTGTIAHNTFAGNTLGVGPGKYGIAANKDYLTLDLVNNIVVSHTYGVYADSGAIVSLDHTLFYSNTLGDTGGDPITNTNAITGQDPLLDSTYHLTAGSPAICAGLTIGWPAFDVDGEPRRLTDPDIGADEYELPTQVYLPLVMRSD